MANDYQAFLKERSAADAAFDRAISEGRLSDDPHARNFAGNYMYMGKDDYSRSNGKDLFKNCVSRAYDV